VEGVVVEIAPVVAGPAAIVAVVYMVTAAAGPQQAFYQSLIVVGLAAIVAVVYMVTAAVAMEAADSCYTFS